SRSPRARCASCARGSMPQPANIAVQPRVLPGAEKLGGAECCVCAEVVADARAAYGEKLRALRAGDGWALARQIAHLACGERLVLTPLDGADERDPARLRRVCADEIHLDGMVASPPGLDVSGAAETLAEHDVGEQALQPLAYDRLDGVAAIGAPAAPDPGD